MNPTLGIDFGTTYSVVSYFKDSIHIIPNNEGTLTTPTTIYFDENDILFGHLASPVSYTHLTLPTIYSV